MSEGTETRFVWPNEYERDLALERRRRLGRLSKAVVVFERVPEPEPPPPEPTVVKAAEIPQPPPPPLRFVPPSRIDAIIKTVCREFNLSKRDFRSPSRLKGIVEPRQIAMYLLRSELGMSMPKIGRVCGGRDHTTVMHALDKIEDRIQTDMDFASRMNALRGAVRQAYNRCIDERDGDGRTAGGVSSVGPEGGGDPGPTGAPLPVASE